MTMEEILDALRAILASADEEGRELTDEEVERYEALEGKLEAVRKTGEIRSRQRAYETPIRPPAVEVAAGRSDDTLDRAFEHYLRTGQANSDIVELRAQGEGVGSEGGYLVPDGFRAKIVERMKAFGGIAEAAETITTTDGRPLPWSGLDDTSNEGAITPESDEFNGGADLVFTKNELSAYKYTSTGTGNQPLRVSVELLQDAAFDVQALISRKLGERIARAQAADLATGTGVGEPLGLVTGLTGIELADDTAGITYNDLVTFIHSVDPAYIENARWVFNFATLGTIRKMEDAAGDPIWRPLTADMASAPGGGTLLGFPVTIDQGMPDLDVDNNAVNWGAFGDIREGYVVRRVRDVQLMVNPYSRMNYGEVEFVAWARMDATQQNTNAYVALTGETP